MSHTDDVTQFGGVWSVALGKWLCSPVGNDGKLDGRLECKNDDVTIGPLSSKSKIEVNHVIIRNSILEFFASGGSLTGET